MNDIGKILNYLYFLFWHKALLYVNISERGVESIHNILCVVYVDNSRYFETGGNRWGPHIPQGNIYLTALRVSLLIMKYLLFLLRIMIFQKIFILRTVSICEVYKTSLSFSPCWKDNLNLSYLYFSINTPSDWEWSLELFSTFIK